MHFKAFNDERLAAQLSGQRFSVTYRLQAASEAGARELADGICEEQTVEFPVAQLPPGQIPEQILGRIERLEARGNFYEAEISYAEELVGNEFTQLLNTVFGNSSIKPGIKVADLRLTPGLMRLLPGPRFGTQGMRSLVHVPTRPLLFTALKPVGLDAADLAATAKTFAEAGIDLIKDDHGIANQVFAPFEERVKRCAAAVAEANAKTGGHTLYIPNITTTATRLRERAFYAKRCGAGGVMVSPGLTGLDAMKCLADDDELGLPVFAHPALLGSNAINPQGFTCELLFGTLMRMAGADASIFPNFGGRFSLSKEECVGIARACGGPMERLRPILPSPAGGMSIARIPEMIDAYGNDFLVLIGGGLFSHGPDLAANCREFVARVEEAGAAALQRFGATPSKDSSQKT